MDACPYHKDHDTRINRLETIVQKLEDQRINPGFWLGLFSLMGIIFSTVGNLLGQYISAFVK